MKSVQLPLVALVLFKLVLESGRHYTCAGLSPPRAKQQHKTGVDLPDLARKVANDGENLDDESFNKIVKGFGEHISSLIEGQMNELLNDVEKSSKSARIDADEKKRLKQLRDANRLASKDIKTRIEMVSAKDGRLTQSCGFTAKACSIASGASEKLQAAAQYIGTKIQAIGNFAARKIPKRLRSLMHWPRFTSFKAKFNKTYQSLSEELYRQMVYLNSQTVVGLQHLKYLLGRSKHLLQATQYSDVTLKEYEQKINNHDDGSDLKGEPTLDQAVDVSRLKRLAREGKNIFGQTMPIRSTATVATATATAAATAATAARSRKAAEPSKQKHRRTRRAIEFVDVDDLDESEDDELEDISMIDDDDFEDDGELGYSIVDDYAASFDSDADLSQLKEIEDILDHALASNDDFTPIDLRDTGCILRPENQNTCGSCYAYVATTAASYYNCMADNRKAHDKRYNSRFTSDCGRYLGPSDHPYLNGCQGGRLSKAIRFLGLVGAMKFFDYEAFRYGYKYDTDQCIFPQPSSLAKHGWNTEPVAMFARSRTLQLKEDQMDLYLRTVGPIYLNIRTWDGFKHYGKGIYDGIEEDDFPVVHSMLIVGHDKDHKGRDYWIVWNSHGINWGEDGFLRIYDSSLRHYAINIVGLMEADEGFLKKDAGLV